MTDTDLLLVVFAAVCCGIFLGIAAVLAYAQHKNEQARDEEWQRRGLDPRHERDLARMLRDSGHL